ncbi:MAG TPA: carbon-nitrogen hydrolase family protein [Polyangiaceae bacterium]
MITSRPIAAAQTTPLRGDVSANLAEHAQLIGRAAARGVQLLVFPELSLTGYELDLAPELAFSEADARLDSLRELALSQAMTLIVGAPIRLAEGLHIGASSMFVIPSDFASDFARLEGYARQHSMSVLFSNYGGPSGGLPAAGRSAILSAQGKPLAQLEANGSGLAVATL